MEMTGFQIFKHLPGGKKEAKANCKECACPTCMAFALKLAKKSIEIEKCPYITQDLKDLYIHSIKPAQKTIEINNLKIGGETVLYRHEKTFVNKTAFAILLDCNNPNYKEQIEEISNFEINIINDNLKIDLIILKNSENKDIPQTKINTISYELFISSDLDIIEEKDFNLTKNYLINARKKAILEKDEEFSSPVCVVMKNSTTEELCARASYYICKYANALVFEKFDRNLFETLMALRQNLYTDPQVTLQVNPGLYKYNNPDKNSMIFLTTNFALTFFAVSNELEALDIPSYLIVVGAEGMSVLTAWSAEKFTAEIVSKTLEDLNIRKEISTRKIIIPGLLEHIKDELTQACPDFEFIAGTNEASDIGAFVSKLNE